MSQLVAIIIVLVEFSSYVEGTTVHGRLTGLFDNFGDDYNVPPDIIDNTDAVDADGVDLDISGHGVVIYDLAVSHLRLFDVGFIDCSDAALTSMVTADGDLPVVTSDSVAEVADRCMILPYVAPDTSQTSYHMAYSIVDSTKEETVYKLQRITAEVNRAKNQYRTTWEAKFGVIVTWRITGGAGTDVFQTVLAVGDNDAGAKETYVLFLYEDLPLAGNGVQGQINGKYTAGSAKFARICSDAANTAAASAAILTANSNYKCGSPGIFVFGTSDDGTLYCTDKATACTVPHAGCNQTNVPKDSCTESFYCTIDPGNTDNAKLTVTLKWYQWKRLQALDYTKFDSTEEQELIENMIVGTSTDACGMDLPDPGTSTSSATYTLSVPAVVNTGICGTVIDTADKFLASCFKIYDNDNADSNPNNRVIDKYGDLVFCGKCYFEDLPLEKQADVLFNDFSPPTVMPPRNRQLVLNTIDRGDADGFYPISAAHPGRNFWLLVTLDPGTPWNRWTEPFGVSVVDCWASNNEDFTHDPTSWERSQKFISNGCPVAQANLEAIYLTKSFEADDDHAINPPTGDPYYQYAGPIKAAKWMNQDKIWFKCTVMLCTDEDEIPTCKDACSTDKRKRRSVEDGENLESVYTQIDILPEEPEAEKQTCRTTLTTTIVTETVLLALLLVMVLLCVFLALKLSPLRKEAKKRSSLKKIPSY